MAAVPEIFNQPGVAFILLKDGEKFPPIEKEWEKKGHTFQQATTHKGNVGVMANINYIGLDQDDPKAFEGLEVPATTMWETRPGRLGIWFKCNDNGNKAEILAKRGKKPDLAQIKLFKDGRSVGEVKLERTYQVIPPSWKILENGQRADYRLVRESPPAEISLDLLLSELHRVGISFSSKRETNTVKPESMANYLQVDHSSGSYRPYESIFIIRTHLTSMPHSRKRPKRKAGGSWN